MGDLTNALGERLVDNAELQRREAWRGDDLIAWIDAERLAQKGYVGWKSEWLKARWMPEKTFGSLK